MGQNIAHVDKLEAHFDKEMSMQAVDTDSLATTQETPHDVLILPDALLTDKARALHGRLREAGLVDEGWMPVGLTNAERGVLAFKLAVRLDIQNQWQVFSSLWGTTSGSLRSAYNKANEQRKTMSFVEKLNIILS